NAQYKRCVDAGVCAPPSNRLWNKELHAKRPVTVVDWRQAKIYAEWVGGRLPTEAEWEKACRNTDSRIYPWGNEAPTVERLNYAESGLEKVIDVGIYPQGVNGLYDMAGNAWEWTSSLYKPYPYKAADGREDPAADGLRTLRGGSYSRDADYV